MTEITTTPFSGTAEQARALLAYAADESHFFDSFGTHLPLLRGENSASTAMYAAQAATANAMLAVAGELAELRAELSQAAVRAELVDVAAAVRELAEAVTASGTDVVDQVADLNVTLSNAVGAGLADVATEVADVSAAIDDRVRRSWRERLRLRRRPTLLEPIVDVAPEAAPVGGLNGGISREVCA